MDYEGATKEEINRAMAIQVLGVGTTDFDFCSTWALTGPVIDKYNIDSFYDRDDKVCGAEVTVEDESGQYIAEFKHYSDSRLYSACIVFLMMQEALRENEKCA